MLFCIYCECKIWPGEHMTCLDPGVPMHVDCLRARLYYSYNKPRRQILTAFAQPDFTVYKSQQYQLQRLPGETEFLAYNDQGQVVNDEDDEHWTM